VKLPEGLDVRRSFRSKLLLAFLGGVVVLVGVALLAVRSETAGQVERVARRAAQQAREASAEIEALRRRELSRVARIFTESQRTLALVEAALEAGDEEYRELLIQELDYELQLRRLDASLVTVTDSRGRHAFTLLEGELVERDTAGVEPLARSLLEERRPDLFSYRLLDGRLFAVQVHPLALGGPPIATVTAGVPVDEEAPRRIGEIVGAEVCFVVRARCVLGTDGARERLGPTMAGAAAGGGTGSTLVEDGGERWDVVSDPLVPERPGAGYRVVAVPLEEVLAPFDRIYAVLAVTGAGSLLAAILLAIFLSRGLTRPVRALVGATERIARGDYDTRVEVATRDELGTLAESFNEMAHGLELKERYRGVLDKVVSREVAEELLGGEVELGGENREVTTLFADLRGFTGLTEGMEPQGVIGLLNACMGRLSAAVEDEGGVVDKYVGDELMAIFGAPITQDDQAVRAVRAALRMRRAIEELNRERERSGEEEIGVGVGINTGLVVAGNMGSPSRLNYTVLGEAVNLASRACKAAGPGEILISEATRSRLGGRVEAEDRGARELKGFSRRVRLWAVKGLRDEEAAGAPREGGGRGGRTPDHGGGGVRALILAGLALLGGVGGAEGQARDGLPTLRDLGAEYVSADGDFQVTASGRLDLETYVPGAEEPWIIPETDPFVAHRLRVFTDVFVGERLYGLMEVRTDRGEEPRAGSPELRLDQAFLRVTSDGGRLSFQAGKFVSPFGGYARRHHTEADPLVRPPLPYEWRTMACDWRVPPDPASFATWKDDPEEFRGPGAPPIWGVPYQWGVTGFASVGDVLLQLALMNSAPSSGPEQWGLERIFDRRPSVVAALGWQATAGLRFDAYYDRGPYMEEVVVGPLPAGTTPDDPVQELFGAGITNRRAAPPFGGRGSRIDGRCPTCRTILGTSPTTSRGNTWSCRASSSRAAGARCGSTRSPWVLPRPAATDRTPPGRPGITTSLDSSSARDIGSCETPRSGSSGLTPAWTAPWSPTTIFSPSSSGGSSSPGAQRSSRSASMTVTPALSRSARTCSSAEGSTPRVRSQR